jgi:hypothetical protein
VSICITSSNIASLLLCPYTFFTVNVIHVHAEHNLRAGEFENSPFTTGNGQNMKLLLSYYLGKCVPIFILFGLSFFFSNYETLVFLLYGEVCPHFGFVLFVLFCLFFSPLISSLGIKSFYFRPGWHSGVGRRFESSFFARKVKVLASIDVSLLTLTFFIPFSLLFVFPYVAYVWFDVFRHRHMYHFSFFLWFL